MVEISSKPYLTSDFAFLPCFSILIGLTFVSLCLPTRYDHAKAMQTIATSLSMRIHITHMGVLDVEAGRFHGSEGRFYLPSFLYVKIALSSRLEAYEVLTYSDVIPYAMAIEPSCPFLSDELAVCHKGVDAFRSEETDKVFHNLLAFLPGWSCHV